MIMAKSSPVPCVRFGLVLLNVYFLIVGVFLLTLSVWIVAIPGTNHAIAITTSSTAQIQIDRLCYVSFALSSAVCLLSLVGFCGTLNNDKYIFFVLGFLMIILVVLEIALGIFAVLLQEKVRIEMIPEMRFSLHFYNGDSANDTISLGWRETQKAFNCCGIDTDAGYENHTNVQYLDEEDTLVAGSNWYRSEGESLGRKWPESCCWFDSNGAINVTSCYSDPSMGEVNNVGCHLQISEFIRRHLIFFPVFCSLLAVFQILGIVLSFRMFKYAKKRTVKDRAS